jgi:hypothetical protein
MDEIKSESNPSGEKLTPLGIFPRRSHALSNFLTGEHFNYVEPLASPTRLMVDKEQAETAREVLKDVTLSFGPSGHEEGTEE